MRHKTMVLLTVIGVFVLTSAPAPAQGCQQQMLRGVWCATCTGFTDLHAFDPRVPENTLVPMNMLKRVVLNPQGKGTGKGVGSVAGVISTIESEDAFTVNQDCTGEKTYTLYLKELGLTLPGKGSVVFMPQRGNFRVLIFVPGNVVTCKYERVSQTEQ